MYEIHANEQYFFTQPTTDALADLLVGFDRPCTLCAPSVGRALAERGRPVAVLDIDDRFDDVPGYRRWDLAQPQRIDERFDVILCDPPFFNISLSRLFDALRVLSHYDLSQKLMVGYLARRADAVESVFAPFGLKQTDHHPAYQTVQKCGRNDIAFFMNFDPPGDWTC